MQTVRTPHKQRKPGMTATLPFARPATAAILASLCALLLGVLVLSPAPALAAAPETPTIAPANEITNTTAVLHGTVNPNLKFEEPVATSWFFQYNEGASCGGGGTTEEKGPFEVAAEPTEAKVRELTTGVPLNPGTQYTFCLVARNEAKEEAVSGPETFTTTAAPPSIIDEFSSNVGTNTATFNSTIEPLGATSDLVSVEYGTSTSYGATLAAVPLGPLEKEGEANPVGHATLGLTGLAPTTSYHYRTIVSSSLGTTTGPDQHFTTLALGVPFKLPDGRNYVQVSSVAKNAAGAFGKVGNVVASAAGNRISYISTDGFPGVRGLQEFPTYLASFDAEAWSTQGLLPPGALREVTIAGYSPDLRYVILETDGVLAPGAFSKNDNFYLYDSLTQTYTTIGEREPGEESQERILVADAKLGCGCFLLESLRKLVPGATPGVLNLYELRDDGELTRVDTGHSPEGASAGPSGGARFSAYTQNTLSEDGRVTFTDELTGQIFMRVDGTSTIPVSAPEEGAPEQPETEPRATWQAETPDGRYVLFTSEARLTSDARTSSGHPDLYRFDSFGRRLEDLTARAPEGANVLGTLGLSDDGSYAYFTATEALTSSAAGGQCTQASEAGCNLYVWHNGAVTLIATLVPSDFEDWVGTEPAGDERKSRVSANGSDVIFTATTSLTGYNNAKQLEIFHYDAPTRSLVCVSCPSTGARATFDSVRLDVGGRTGPASLIGTLTRNLSADGQRVFFNTTTPLVPEDTNGQMDVYEWTQEGTGGSPHLISTGRSKEESYLGDASSDGSNVFFFTSESLVGQDTDHIPDLYDARIGPGIASQNPPTGAPPCGGGDCGGSGVASLPASLPASANLNGAGNLSPLPPAPPAKPPTAAQVRAKALAKVLRTCRSKHNRHKRRACEAQARRRYGAGHARRASHHNRRTK